VSALDELKVATQRRGSFRQTLGAVLWSFFGVRKGSAHDADMASLNPVHVILVGLLAGLIFVLSLVILVRVIISG
jgi:hypothetical protein